MGPTGSARILQIHPTRQCNLSCLHCYSQSSPRERAALDLDLLCEAVTAAAREGYNTVSMSGGEPLMYKPLRELLQHARAHGMRTTVTTNGMLLNARNIGRIAGVVDILAISLDGTPASHNRMRGNARAFESMQARLADVRAAGIDFGFIFTLTQHNLDELDWVKQFAEREGAKLLQVHPLEEVGNAARGLRGKTPDSNESAYAWFMSRQFEQAGAGLKVQVDVAFSEHLKAHPESVSADAGVVSDDQPFAELVSPLVIEADATVVPIQYGFARDYVIGNLQYAELRPLLRDWRARRLPGFYALCRSLHAEVTSQPPHFLNWYDLLGQYAEQAGRVAAARMAA
jgi:Fe-coproporphyrin III synthase